MSIGEFAQQLNTWGKSGIPFIFFIDFEMKHPVAIRLDQVRSDSLLFNIHGFSNAQDPVTIEFANHQEVINKRPLPFADYCRKFNKVQQHLGYGDSFLTNLTISTEVSLQHTLKELFFISKARYKLWVRDRFLVFSPEIFVQIRTGRIYSYPMKGTVDAAIPHAAELILADEKELAEHVTIVDLIRNDLSQVAQEIVVNRFRYIETVTTNEKSLLQVSSEIEGRLPQDYRSRLGDILVRLLPAGSVSGAPKPKTLEIIREAEGMERGYYTGVMGYFDGESLDSGVMIRYIEQREDGLYYRSGGGITTQSHAEREYREAIDKVYVPIA